MRFMIVIASVACSSPRGLRDRPVPAAPTSTPARVDSNECPPGTTRREREVADPLSRDQVVYRETACVLSDGTLHGHYELVWEDGTLKERGSYAQGIRTGRWRILGGQDGSYREGEFVDGVQQGEWRSYWQPGRVAWIGTFHHDKRHGRFEWFRTDGSKQQAGELFEDQQDGTWTFWRANGSVDRIETWKRGTRVQ